VCKDPGERRDLAAEMPGKVQELDARLTAYLQSVGAQLPALNPDFDPSKASETAPLVKQRKGGKGAKRHTP
jgi:hypothetical protein